VSEKKLTKEINLTSGSIGKAILAFVLPYLLSCFMQTFYGLVDLYVVGKFNSSATTTAVSVGSQITHMITVIIVGIAMGSTVKIGNEVGQKDEEAIRKTIGTSIGLFSVLAIILTAVLILFTKPITVIILTPKEAVNETISYLKICFAGVPFIVAYNIISSIFRGLGDTKRPMYFVAVACVTNIILDFVFVGACNLGARGAALGTILGQAVSVFSAFVIIRKRKIHFGISKKDIIPDRKCASRILNVGVPIAAQDGFIQVSFIVITIIANSRGLIDSAAVGIVEKLIGFLFLVPSSFLSAISTLTAQNLGAGKSERAVKTLHYGLYITMGWGILCATYCQIAPSSLVHLFTKETPVIVAGCAYLKAYSVDCFFAAIHFCFSGYFCGCQKSYLSFIHNIISILLIRIPGAYLASIWYPHTLFPMGLAAPLGSLISAFICFGFYWYLRKQDKLCLRKS